MTSDEIWRAVTREIPSAHLPPDLCTQIFGARRALVEFAQVHSTLRYLEVGCRLGHSLAAVLLAAPAGTATVIDAWIDNYGGEPNLGPSAVSAHLTALGVAATRVEFLSGDSHVLLPMLLGERYDLIFIDGDHTPDGAAQDLTDAARLLTSHGLIVFDDAWDGLDHVVRDRAAALGLRVEQHHSTVPWAALYV